jgi:hypothetical protein
MLRKLWHLPTRLACHARQRFLMLSWMWPWKDVFLTYCSCSLPCQELPDQSHCLRPETSPPRRGAPVLASSTFGRHRRPPGNRQPDTAVASPARTLNRRGWSSPDFWDEVSAPVLLPG